MVNTCYTYPFWRNFQSAVQSCKQEINNAIAELSKGLKKEEKEKKKVEVELIKTTIICSELAKEVFEKIAGQAPEGVEVEIQTPDLEPTNQATISWMIKVETTTGQKAYSRFGYDKSLTKGLFSV